MTDPSSLKDSRELDLASLRPILEGGPKPLFATVSGAHLYGFPSADSDVDIRGSYVRPLDSVLGLGPHLDTIDVSEFRDGLEVDWVAHDVHKFVTMMTKRNGYVLEQLYSPLVVWGGEWLDELRVLGRPSMVRPLYFHYRGFYHTQQKAIANGNVSAKAVLYAYRVLLSGIHALSAGEVEAHLPTLLLAYPQAEVASLITRKQQGQEKGKLDDQEARFHTEALEKLEAVLDQTFQSSRLPDTFESVAPLSDFVVRARKALGA